MTHELDLERFWHEQRESEGKHFRTDKPRVPIGIAFDDHWLIEEMQLPSTVRYYKDLRYQVEANKACNERVERAIGCGPFKRIYMWAVDRYCRYDR